MALNEALADRPLAGGPTPTRDIAAGLADLTRYGIAIHENYIDNALLAALSERIHRQAAAEASADAGPVPAHAPGTMRTVKFLANKGRCFIDLMMNPAGLAYAKRLLGTDHFRLFSQNALIIGPGDIGVRTMHADQQTFGFRTPRPLMLNIMVALENYDAAAGATEFVFGSHGFECPSMDRASDDQTRPGIAIDVKPGSAIMWEGRTWHRAGINRSDRTRVSVTTIFCDPVMNPQHVMVASVHDTIYEMLAEEEKSVLGFAAVNGTNLTCPRSAGDRQRQINQAEPFIGERG